MILQPHVRTFDLAILVLPLAIGLALMLLIYFKRPVREDGWNYIIPGPGMWFLSVALLAFYLLILWVWAVVGSARSDAVSQLQAGYWLAIVFGAFSVISLWRIYISYREQVRWRGGEIRRVSASREVAFRLSDLTNCTSGITERVTLTFCDGSSLAFEENARGASHLSEEANKILGRDPDHG